MFPHFDQSEYAVALKNAYRQFPAKDSTLDIDFINNRNRVAGVQGAALDGVTFTRSTTATYFGSDGLLKTAAVNEPRFEYSPVSRRPLGLLIEESRANLLTYSEQFDNAAWTKNNASVTANAAAAPDGTTTADKLVEGLTNDVHFVQKNVSVTAQAYSVSVYAKAAERTQFILALGDTVFSDSVLYNLSTASASVFGGSPTGLTIQPVGSGWYRCSFTKTASGSGTAAIRVFTASAGAISYQGDGTSGLYIWGAQLEAGAFATSYIPTTSASVTRGTDVASMTGTNFSSWFNTSGVFVVQADWISATNAALLNAQGPTITDRHQIKADGPIAATVTGGTVVSEFYYAPFLSLLSKRIAYQYADNNFVLAQNGIITNTDTSGAVPTNLQTLEIGQWAFAGICLNGHLQRITNYKQLPNNLLQYITRLTA